MVKLSNEYGKSTSPNRLYKCDTADDLKDIPSPAMGDGAYIISSAELFMCDSKGNWILQ